MLVWQVKRRGLHGTVNVKYFPNHSLAIAYYEHVNRDTYHGTTAEKPERIDVFTENRNTLCVWLNTHMPNAA